MSRAFECGKSFPLHLAAEYGKVSFDELANTSRILMLLNFRFWAWNVELQKKQPVWSLINTKCWVKIFSGKEKKVQKMSLEKSVGKAFKYLAVLYEEKYQRGENEKCLKLILSLSLSLRDIPGKLYSRWMWFFSRRTSGMFL